MKLDNIPSFIASYLATHKYKVDDVGHSTSDVLIFDEHVLKITDVNPLTSREVLVLSWLQGKLPVPEMVYHDIYEGKGYLLMSKIQGVMSCDEQYMKRPKCLVTALTEGLHALWNVNIEHCPVHMTLENKLKLAEYQVEHNLVDVEDAEPSTFSNSSFKNPEQLLVWLKQNKPTEELVLSHGDYCLPNIMIHNDKLSGFIDLGQCGVADKWQDIALCYRSLEHNFAGNYSDRAYDGYNSVMFFDQLGVKKDADKLRYYILLDELF